MSDLDDPTHRRADEDAATQQAIRDYLDAVDASVAEITDADINERISRAFNAALPPTALVRFLCARRHSDQPGHCPQTTRTTQ